MEEYGKAGPQGRRFFLFQTKKAPVRRELSAGQKNAAACATAYQVFSFKKRLRSAAAYFFQNSSITPLTA